MKSFNEVKESIESIKSLINLKDKINVIVSSRNKVDFKIDKMEKELYKSLNDNN